MGFILCWFRLHRAILHSWVDIRVHLVLWQCSWGLSGVLSKKLSLLTCLIWNSGLLCTQWRESKSHLPVWAMCHGISRVVAGTWGIFSSYRWDGHSKLHLRCWWKVGSNLQSKTGNQLSSWNDMGCMELFLNCCTDINIHINLRWVSQGMSVDSSRKSSHLYCMLCNTG